MTLFPCKCCNCPACPDFPSRFTLNLTYPSGGGVMFEDSQTPKTFDSVATNCLPTDFGSIRKIYIENPGQSFSEAPDIQLPVPPGGSRAEVESIVTGQVIGFDIDDPGEGYSTYPDVVFSNGDAKAFAEVAGPVDSVQVTYRGLGYNPLDPPTVQFSDPQGTQATARVVLTQYVKEIVVENGGSGYRSSPFSDKPTASIGQSSTPQDSAFLGSPDVRQKITAIAVTNGGSGYTSAPEIVIAGQDSYDFSARAIVQNGVVTAVEIDRPGRFLPIREAFDPGSRPVSIEGGGGTGAEASVTGWDNFIYQISVSDAGTNYTEPPAVTITAPHGSGATARAVMGYHLKEVIVEQPGFNYTPEIQVQINGGSPEVAAGASATINGSVTGLVITDGGKYYNSRDSDQQPQPWTAGSRFSPETTVSIQFGGGSGAQVTPKFSGVLTGVTTPADTTRGSGYLEPFFHTVPGSYSGPDGRPAVIKVFPFWQPESQVDYHIGEDCVIFDTIQYCTDQYYIEQPLVPAPPPPPGLPPDPPFDPVPPGYLNAGLCDTVIGHAERIFVSLRAEFRGVGYLADPLMRVEGETPPWPQGRLFLLPGEAAWVQTISHWDKFSYYKYDGFGKLFVNRLFQRVPPQGNFEYAGSAPQAGTVRSISYSIVSLPFSVATGRKARFFPSYTVIVDAKGDQIWKLTSLAVLDQGENLNIRDEADGDGKFEIFMEAEEGNNFWGESSFSNGGPLDLIPVKATVTYSPPVGRGISGWYLENGEPGDTVSFGVQPVVSYQFTPVSGSTKYYQLSGVIIESQGSGAKITNLDPTAPEELVQSGALIANGPDILLEGFYDDDNPAQNERTVNPEFRLNISDGKVTSATVTTPGKIRGGGKITSATIQAPEEEPDTRYFIVGRQEYATEKPCISNSSEWEQYDFLAPFAEFEESALQPPAVNQSEQGTFFLSYPDSRPSEDVDAILTRRCGLPTISFSIT